MTDITRFSWDATNMQEWHRGRYVLYTDHIDALEAVKATVKRASDFLRKMSRSYPALSEDICNEAADRANELDYPTDKTVELSPSVGIKPLEWKPVALIDNYNWLTIAQAAIPFGRYTIDKHDKGFLRAMFNNQRVGHFDADVDSKDAAKAAAQADYEQRILSAIVQSPALEGNREPHPLAAFPGGLPLGLYVIHWKSGGTSEAAIGMSSNGQRWIAPTNWTAPGLVACAGEWAEIERAERIHPEGNQQVIETLRAERDEARKNLSTLPLALVGKSGQSALVLADKMRTALEWYANPEIYRPHPHGLAFDKRDLSYVARAALSLPTQEEESKFEAWIETLQRDVVQDEYGYEEGEFNVTPENWRPLFDEGLTPLDAFKRALSAHRSPTQPERGQSNDA